MNHQPKAMAQPMFKAIAVSHLVNVAPRNIVHIIAYHARVDFVKSARILGAGHIRIIFAHILPNAAVSLLTAAAIGFNNAVLAEASMSYLGLGIQPPEPSLGRMLYEAQSYLFNAPWYAIGPGVTIILIILGFSMVSEGLRSMQQ